MQRGRDRMKHFWKEILEYGPRSVGTPAHDRVTDYIFNEMKKLSGHAYLDGFIFFMYPLNSPAPLPRNKNDSSFRSTGSVTRRNFPDMHTLMALFLKGGSIIPRRFFG